MNPRQMAQAMKKMGINQEEIDAIAVIIRTKTEDIIIRNPSVQKVNMSGSSSYQISGDEERRRNDDDDEIEISDEDIETVATQGKVSKDKAKELLIKNKGDLAASILELQN